MPNFLQAHPFAVIGLLVAFVGLFVALSVIFKKSYQIIPLKSIPLSLVGDTSMTLFSNARLQLIESRKDKAFWGDLLRIEDGEYMCHANERTVATVPEHSTVNILTAEVFKNKQNSTSSLVLKGNIHEHRGNGAWDFFWISGTIPSSKFNTDRSNLWHMKARFWGDPEAREDIDAPGATKISA